MNLKTPPVKLFIIMPFKNECIDIYKDVIKDVFETAGYIVSRTDFNLSQNNVISKIIQGINDADLIVADISESNGNVLYELGLAHAIRKDVIIISQTEPPFDLRNYQVNIYQNTDIGLHQIRFRLQTLAYEFLRGEVSFSSPAKDFGLHTITDLPSQRGVEGQTAVDTSINDKVEQWQKSINDVFELTNTLSGQINSFSIIIAESSTALGNLDASDPLFILKGQASQQRIIEAFNKLGQNLTQFDSNFEVVYNMFTGTTYHILNWLFEFSSHPIVELIINDLLESMTKVNISLTGAIESTKGFHEAMIELISYNQNNIGDAAAKLETKLMSAIARFEGLNVFFKRVIDMINNHRSTDEVS
jgi:hypothetical protein